MKDVQKVLLHLFHFAEWCIIAAAAAFVLLMLLGIYPYAVRTGSMEPTIPAGSICFVNQRTAFADVQKDDIIVFRMDEIIVTHRAVKIHPDGITTRGDANTIEDAAKTTSANYIGKTIFWIPGIGKLFLFMQTKKGKIMGIAMIFLFTSMIFYENRVSKRLSGMEENADHNA